MMYEGGGFVISSSSATPVKNETVAGTNDTEEVCWDQCLWLEQ